MISVLIGITSLRFRKKGRSDDQDGLHAAYSHVVTIQLLTVFQLA